MESTRLSYLFQRYADQTCTEEEVQELMQLISRADHDAALRSLMDELWNGLPPHQKLSPVKAEKILHSILTHERNVIPIQQNKRKIPWFQVAASIAFMVLGSATLVWFILSSTNVNSDQHAISKTGGLALEHRLVKLPDGSSVILNAGSTLDFPDSFQDQNNREVFLSGEGYFDIQHDAERPFLVHTEGLTTTVLGTAFNIKAYPEDRNITVTVTRGKVKVSDQKKVIGIITPNQQITFDKEQNAAKQAEVDSRNSIAWADKDIFFDDITLQEAVRQLSERFNTPIRLGNEALKSCRFTATFVRGENLDQILNVICEFNGATYKNDGTGTIEINGEGCTP